MRPREWHSRTGDRIVRDKSGYGKNATESGTHKLEAASYGASQDTERMRPRVALTNWGPHRMGQVKIRKECDREWHSRPGDRIIRDKSGHGKNATEGVALTHWRPHRKRYGKNATESATHALETAS